MEHWPDLSSCLSPLRRRSFSASVCRRGMVDSAYFPPSWGECWIPRFIASHYTGRNGDRAGRQL